MSKEVEHQAWRDANPVKGPVGWVITCPNPACGFRDPIQSFSPSLADECWCPICGEAFVFERGNDDDDDND